MEFNIRATDANGSFYDDAKSSETNIIYNDVDEIRSNLNPEHTPCLRRLREYNLR